MNKLEYRFTELAKQFLIAFNPRYEDEIVCLDCILCCPEKVIDISIPSRHFSYKFVHYFYGNPQGNNLRIEAKEYIDDWKQGYGV